MIEDVQALLQVAATLRSALADLDKIVDASPAGVHLQWAIELVGEHVDTMSRAMLVVAPAHAVPARRPGPARRRISPGAS